MISQTSSGQTSLKRLKIDFDLTSWVRVMDGVLVRILKRMRGLQSVNLGFKCTWVDIVDDLHLLGRKERHERTARDLLLLIREELFDIKKVTIGWNGGMTYTSELQAWMSHELKKRNEAWAPPLPRYKKFRRTFSPLSIMDADIATSVVQREEKLRPKRSEGSLAHLERKYAVF